jgi:galactose mutarotase-like enzyme
VTVRVEHGEAAGWRTIALAGEVLRATVLPDKGASILALEHLPSGVDVLFKTPWGLQPPGSPPREGADGHAFLENYEGGWQELFPNCNDPCEYRGLQLPFHGEVATVPWSVEPLAGADGEVAGLRCRVDCELVPFSLERVLRLDGDALVVEQRATNTSAEPWQVVWGHHLVLGAPLIGSGARLELPARTIVTLPEAWEPTARLAPGQRTAWPEAALAAGGTVDLSAIPGPDAGSHDDVFLTDLEEGRARVVNEALGLAFELAWDAAVFGWVVSWQPYGGAEAMPLRGSYALGLEPWVSNVPLAQAVADGSALEVAGGASIATSVRASVTAV